MRAAVLESPNLLSVKEVADPEPFGRRPVRVRIGAVGVCGSDVLRYGKGKAYHYPLVMGHEFSAVVEALPPGSELRVGQKVAVFPCLPDPADPLTRVGEYVLSSDYDYYGSRRDGAMAEWLWVPEDNLIPVPDSVPLVHAAVVEPAAVALHGVLKLDVPAAAVALVIGAGPIGALAAQWLRIRGVSRVIVADIDARKLEIMAALGFEVLDATAGDTVTTARAMTQGRGCDIAVEASGVPASLVQAVTAVTTFGQVLILGDVSGDVTLPRELVSSVLRREVRIIGTWNSKIAPAGHSEWEMVVHHIAQGDLHVAPLISHTPTLSEAPEVFEDLLQRRTWYNKVVFAIAPEARSELADPAVAPRLLSGGAS